LGLYRSLAHCAQCDNPLCRKQRTSQSEAPDNGPQEDGWIISGSASWCSAICQNVELAVRDPNNKWHVPKVEEKR
jgi:hypothetical protein